MNRLPLILCLVALLATAVSGVLYFRIGNSKELLELRLKDADVRAAKLDADLASTHEQNGALKVRMEALGAEIEASRKKLTAAEGRAVGLEKDLGATKQVLALYESTARDLAADVEALRKDIADVRATHATPETVAAYKNAIAELERQLATARNGAALTAGAGASTAVFASRAGRATVLTVGPQSAFVVINFGALRGAQLGQKMTVSQGGAVVATVQISDVRDNFSVAQVLPETLRGVLQKGDSAVLIR